MPATWLSLEVELFHMSRVEVRSARSFLKVVVMNICLETLLSLKQSTAIFSSPKKGTIRQIQALPSAIRGQCSLFISHIRQVGYAHTVGELRLYLRERLEYRGILKGFSILKAVYS